MPRAKSKSGHPQFLGWSPVSSGVGGSKEGKCRKPAPEWSPMNSEQGDPPDLGMAVHTNVPPSRSELPTPNILRNPESERDLRIFARARTPKCHHLARSRPPPNIFRNQRSERDLRIYAGARPPKCHLLARSRPPPNIFRSQRSEARFAHIREGTRTKVPPCSLESCPPNIFRNQRSEQDLRIYARARQSATC